MIVKLGIRLPCEIAGRKRTCRKAGSACIAVTTSTQNNKNKDGSC
jgi:hypothetical protein